MPDTNKDKERHSPLVLVDTENLTREEWLEWRRHGIGGSDVSAIIGVSPFRTARDMTSHRLMKYVNDQYAKFCKKSPYQKDGYYYDKETILTDYRDYLCMSEGLELDLKNSFVLFPADLKKAHDKVNDISDKKQALLYDRQIQKQFEEMNQRYHFVKYGFAVLLPRTAKEILEEGQNLHHCVGSYVKKVVKRESTILFVRKVGEQGKSLCTVEIHNGELVQARCYKNEPPTPAIQRFLDIWEKEILHAPALAAA